MDCHGLLGKDDLQVGWRPNRVDLNTMALCAKKRWWANG